MKLYYDAEFHLYDGEARVYPTYNEGMMCLDTKTGIIEGYFTGDYFYGRIIKNIFEIKLFLNQSLKDFSICLNLKVESLDEIAFPDSYDLYYESISLILDVKDKIQNQDKIDSFLENLQTAKTFFGSL